MGEIRFAIEMGRWTGKRIVLPEPRVWPEAIDELESFEYSISDAGNVKTSAPVLVQRFRGRPGRSVRGILVRG